jgi:hypothetical protein
MALRGLRIEARDMRYFIFPSHLMPLASHLNKKPPPFLARVFNFRNFI